MDRKKKKKKNEQPTGLPPMPQLEGDEEEAKQEEAEPNTYFQTNY